MGPSLCLYYGAFKQKSQGIVSSLESGTVLCVMNGFFCIVRGGQVQNYLKALRYGFFDCCYLRPITITAILRQKKAPSKRVLNVWSESVTWTCVEVDLIAQVPVNCIHDPNIKNAGQVLVDGVLRSIFKQSNENPVS